ncbi:hypothetical protein [Klebsiella pneumoniae IS53]|nr:hypothetical protein [Klebsiella pneumoniae IS53]
MPDTDDALVRLDIIINMFDAGLASVRRGKAYYLISFCHQAQ